MADAVEVMGEGVSDYVRGRALHNQSILLFWQARYCEVLALSQQSLSCYRRRAAEVDSEDELANDGATSAPWREDVAGAMASTLNTQGLIQVELGRFDEAEVVLTDADDMAKALELAMIEALVVHNRGTLALRADRLDGALSRAEEMVAAVESDGLARLRGRRGISWGPCTSPGDRPGSRCPSTGARSGLPAAQATTRWRPSRWSGSPRRSTPPVIATPP